MYLFLKGASTYYRSLLYHSEIKQEVRMGPINQRECRNTCDLKITGVLSRLRLLKRYPAFENSRARILEVRKRTRKSMYWRTISQTQYCWCDGSMRALQSRPVYLQCGPYRSSVYASRNSLRPLHRANQERWKK